MDYKQLFNDLLENLINQNGSDLHIGTGIKPSIRIDGELIFLVNFKETTEADVFGILEELLDQERIAIFRKNKVIDFSSNLNEGQTQLREMLFTKEELLQWLFV